jgi:hypothetical protein
MTPCDEEEPAFKHETETLLPSKNRHACITERLYDVYVGFAATMMNT